MPREWVSGLKYEMYTCEKTWGEYIISRPWFKKTRKLFWTIEIRSQRNGLRVLKAGSANYIPPALYILLSSYLRDHR
jgi:hypothetical protein